MIPTEFHDLIMPAVVAVLWYLLKQKDNKQQEELNSLKSKHEDNVKMLQELRLHVAEGHYKKAELDSKFDKLDKTISTSFDLLGKKFDNLSEILVGHITQHHIHQRSDDSKGN